MSLRKTHQLRRHFLKASTPNRMSVLLKTELYRLQLMAESPVYNLFSVPKRNGKLRWIEDPDKPLKTVQGILNDYLQAVYFLGRTDAAFGFLIGVKKDKDPRNIITNAERHLGMPHLLNADMKDFFHTVKAAAVFRIFTESPFEFSTELAELLTGLTTHQGRLPMGAPTSPVLSNFAAIGLDNKLQQLADWGSWRYTRFADDMSFSSETAISVQDIHKIRDIVESFDFMLNDEKLKSFGPDDEKTVTGLVVADKVRLPTEYIPKLQREIDKLNSVVDAQYQMGWKKSRWVEKYKQQVTGRVNFATYVMGEDLPESIHLYEKLDKALEAPTDFMPVNWMEFDYW